MNKQFKVGDRVKVVSYVARGERGTVIEVKPYLPFPITLKMDNVECEVDLYTAEELEHFQEEYTLHNRHSDMICWVMENKTVGGWYSDLRDKTHETIPFPRIIKSFMDYDEKEIFFSLMWVVDDETLDALIEEMDLG